MSAPMSASRKSKLTHAAIFALVRRIPEGRVATYGQIARLAGHPRAARQVGYAMHQCPPGLPWPRVINARGRLSLPEGRTGALAQRGLGATGRRGSRDRVVLGPLAAPPSGRGARLPRRQPPVRTPTTITTRRAQACEQTATAPLYQGIAAGGHFLTRRLARRGLSSSTGRAGAQRRPEGVNYRMDAPRSRVAK